MLIDLKLEKNRCHTYLMKAESQEKIKQAFKCINVLLTTAGISAIRASNKFLLLPFATIARHLWTKEDE
jgi:hypothetical protein